VSSLLRKSLHNTLSPNVTMFSYVQVHVARMTEAVLERLGIPEQVDEELRLSCLGTAKLGARLSILCRCLS
jgi:hypothetical protein